MQCLVTMQNFKSLPNSSGSKSKYNIKVRQVEIDGDLRVTLTLTLSADVRHTHQISSQSTVWLGMVNLEVEDYSILCRGFGAPRFLL